MLCKLVAGADHVPSTSPSVYVAYENLWARTECRRFDDGLWVTGDSYNTTLAYKPEDLSTSHCVYGSYKRINYTELQYPPSESAFGVCYYQESGYHHAAFPRGFPIFSYPPDVSLLIPSWKSCTMSDQGAFDPPQTLNKATAMAPVTSSPLPAAPAATVVPAHAPATPTPDPKDPQAATLTAASPVDPAHSGSSSDPGKSGLGSEQGQQNSSPPKSRGPEAGQTLPSSFHLVADNSPSNNFPSNRDPSKNDPGSLSNTVPPANNPSQNDPPINSPPGNGQSSNKDPASNKYPSNGDPAKNDLESLVASLNSPSPQVNAQSQTAQSQSPASGNPNNANSVQPQGLGAQIASAFGYVPGSTASSVNNPDVPNSEPKPIETVVNGSPSPVIAGGSPVQKASNGAVLVAGEIVAQGSQATVSGAVVSVGSDSVAIDGTNHAFPPLADKTPTPLMVGANTAQRIPNGGLVVASQTLALGGQATVAGVVVSVGSSEAVLDGTTHNLAPNAPTPLSLIVNGATTALQPSIAGASEAPVINIGGQAMTLSQASPGINVMGQTLTPGVPHQGSPFMIAGQTLTPGGAAITVSGIPISLPASQSLATIHPAMANEASALWEGGSASGATPVTVGNQVFTPNPSAFAIAGATISAGGQGVTIAGTPISLQPSGAGLVVGSSTLAVAASAASAGSPTPITIGTQVFTPNPSAFVIAGTTISAGGPGATVAGTFISLQPSGAGLVVGSSTIALPSQSITPNAITIGTQVFTPNPTGFSIASTMISAGGPGITVDGTVVSLETSGGGVVVGSSTIGFEGTSMSIRSATSDPSSAAASATSNLVAGDTSAMSTSRSVLSTSSGGGKTTSSQPTRAISSDGYTHFARGMAGFLIILIANILALSI